MYIGHKQYLAICSAYTAQLLSDNMHELFKSMIFVHIKFSLKNCICNLHEFSILKNTHLVKFRFSNIPPFRLILSTEKDQCKGAPIWKSITSSI